MAGVGYDIWLEIAQYLPCNLLLYLKLSHICRSARLAFTSDELWRKITPDDSPNYYNNFILRLAAMHPDEQDCLAKVWSRHPLVFAQPKLYIRYFLRDIVSTKFPNNADIVFACCMVDGSILEFCPQYHANRSIALAALKSYGYALFFVAEKLKCDFEIVDTAVENVGMAMTYAAEELKDNEEIVQKATRNNALVFALASYRLRANRPFCLDIVRQNGRAYEFVVHRHDRKLAMAAVKNNGLILEYAPRELRSDKIIVMRAVKNRGGALSFASPNLRQNIDIVLAAVKSEPCALEWASEGLRNNLMIVMQAVSVDGLALEFASPRLRANKQVVLAAVRNNGEALQFASEELKDDLGIVKHAVRNSHLKALALASPKIRGTLVGLFLILTELICIPLHIGLFHRLVELYKQFQE